MSIFSRFSKKDADEFYKTSKEIGFDAEPPTEQGGNWTVNVNDYDEQGVEQTTPPRRGFRDADGDGVHDAIDSTSDDEERRAAEAEQRKAEAEQRKSEAYQKEREDEYNAELLNKQRLRNLSEEDRSKARVKADIQRAIRDAKEARRPPGGIKRSLENIKLAKEAGRPSMGSSLRKAISVPRNDRAMGLYGGVKKSMVTPSMSMDLYIGGRGLENMKGGNSLQGLRNPQMNLSHLRNPQIASGGIRNPRQTTIRQPQGIQRPIIRNPFASNAPVLRNPYSQPRSKSVQPRNPLGGGFVSPLVRAAIKDSQRVSGRKSNPKYTKAVNKIKRR